MSVLDAYAVIAYLRDEPCADEVAELLREPTVLTSVNAAEVVDQLVRVFGLRPLTTTRRPRESHPSSLPSHARTPRHGARRCPGVHRCRPRSRNGARGVPHRHVGGPGRRDRLVGVLGRRDELEHRRHASAYLAMQGDGNAVIYAGGRALWSTNTSRNSGARLIVQNDGNVVIYSAANRPLWSSWAAQRRSLGSVRPR